MAKIKLITNINTAFFGFDDSRKILINNSLTQSTNKEKAVNDACNNIPTPLFLNNSNKYALINITDYAQYKRDNRKNDDNDSLIFKVDSLKDGNDTKYTISTGLYCGVINFEDNKQLEIRTGYSDTFFKRMLNFCCGIYADETTSQKSSESESIYSLLIQYMFLISLRKVIAKTIPKRYVYLKERGYNIRGNIDIEKFINYDLFASDKMVSYKYSKRLEIQPIIDVLHQALKCCKIANKDTVLPRLTEFKSRLNELCSDIKPSKQVINAALNDKCLTNSLYADYKKPLEYAKILINSNDLNSGDKKNISCLSGFLVDASFLWEMYLYNLMCLNLPDWTIKTQSIISFYNDTFYPKNNYPDFVLTNRSDGRIFVLDAKFKRMNYTGTDVDNRDMQQIHSYSYYFSLTENEKFAGAALIYPSKSAPSNEKPYKDSMFGIKSSKYKFGILSLKDPSKNETMLQTESEFIKELQDFLEPLQQG